MQHIDGCVFLSSQYNNQSIADEAQFQSIFQHLALMQTLFQTLEVVSSAWRDLYCSRPALSATCSAQASLGAEHCREQCPHLWLYSVLAETVRLFQVSCSVSSLFSRLISPADSSCSQSHPLLLPSEGCPGWNPPPLVAPGSPKLGSVGTPSSCSGRIIMGYAQI